MNALKTKTTIYCETCGCPMRRTKTINVEAATKEEAIEEAKEKVSLWIKSLNGQNCQVCRSIMAGV